MSSKVYQLLTKDALHTEFERAVDILVNARNSDAGYNYLADRVFECSVIAEEIKRRRDTTDLACSQFFDVYERL